MVCETQTTETDCTRIKPQACNVKLEKKKNPKKRHSNQLRLRCRPQQWLPSNSTWHAPTGLKF